MQILCFLQMKDDAYRVFSLGTLSPPRCSCLSPSSLKAPMYGGLKNVGDLKRQPFYVFLHCTCPVHSLLLGALLCLLGGLPFFIWGMGVRVVYVLHATLLVNSVGHMWGYQVWKTGDFSEQLALGIPGARRRLAQ
ncbi:putative acyl-CoA desaturase [Rosa chinensis]|uniref:Putative acyl-CoA desaturase n=1 Tax=Rosa chinensis TaxID=74649 RepID=A0A2P6PEE5_ROSCH|nr:putative acyl-CoA desaturase [Rosa chinensis]